MTESIPTTLWRELKKNPLRALELALFYVLARYVSGSMQRVFDDLETEPDSED